MKLPLEKQLKKRLHVEIALLQDEIVEIMYSIAPLAVLHGGTAIWRCFGASRFSEDLDFYSRAQKGFKEKLFSEAKKRGLVVSKFKQTQNTVFSKISNGFAEARLEIALRDFKEKTVTPYEKTDGSFIDIYSLSVKDLLAEKIRAFLSRKLARDLYDIYFLSSKTQDFSGINNETRDFLDKKVFPVDEKNLKALVYLGVAPRAHDMIETISKRFSW